MSESIIFDTHCFVKRLTDAGLALPIAEALDEHAQLLKRNLATKQTIAALQSVIAGPPENSAQLRTESADRNVELIKFL